jgi:hypothetical protein
MIYMHTYSVDVSGVELGGLLEEEEAGMGVHHILYEGHHVLGHEMGAVPTCDQRHKLRGLVVTAGRQPAIRAQPIHTDRLCFKGRHYFTFFLNSIAEA